MGIVHQRLISEKKDEMRETIQLFKILRNKNKIEILLLLKKKPLHVSEIKKSVSFSFSTASQYLKEMEIAGLVEKTKYKRWMIYRLKSDNKLMWDILNMFEKYTQKNKEFIW